MNFQVTVLKILVSYADGFAVMADLKRDMAILATSGRDWSERTTRLASRVPDLDIFSQGLIERLNGGWRIAEKGRAVLDFMEAKTFEPPRSEVHLTALQETPALRTHTTFEVNTSRRNRLQRRRAARERGRAKAS